MNKQDYDMMKRNSLQEMLRVLRERNTLMLDTKEMYKELASLRSVCI